MARLLRFDSLLGPDGWLTPGYLDFDSRGRIEYVGKTPSPGLQTENYGGIAIPGMPNLHSHAFQRAIAGRGERGRGKDSFWTWRKAMYDCALQLTPAQVEAISAWCYVEMLEAGMTSVGEFHYLHHDPEGRSYANPAEMSLRVAEAANLAGIGLTHLPVFYAHSGIGAAPTEAQRRFVHSDPDTFLALLDRLEMPAGHMLRRVGIAPHSLRAVTMAELHALLAGMAPRDDRAPVHIHIAEQRAEVEACQEHLGARPVDYLLDHAAVDAHWCLVHATHVVAEEVQRMARSGACLGLCTSTEANLGDGSFPLPEYLAAGGTMGIGSDSQIEVDPCAELRWAEYQHRLREQRRAVLAGLGDGSPHPGRLLWETSAKGGAQALGQDCGQLAPGKLADVVVLDPTHPRMLEVRRDLRLDAFVFSAGPGAVRDVMVGGRWQVRNGEHLRRREIYADFAGVMKQLFGRR